MTRPNEHVQRNRLGPRTWPETASNNASALLIPLGATEQHGPHLPFETDTIIATAWADGVAAALDDAIAAPPLPYGSSGEHQAFAGTLSIGGPALHQVVVELTRSAASTFDRVVLLSGHAGNDGALRVATDQLRAEGHEIIHLVPTWPTDRFGPFDAHAGRTETSLMLHLAPERVHLDRAEAGTTDDLAEVLERLMADGVAAVAPNGVLGDPEGASADEGRILLADLVDRTVAQLSRPSR